MRLPVMRFVQRSTYRDASMAAGLCMLLLVQPVVAEGVSVGGPAGGSAKVSRSSRRELQGCERTLHALNRLTFGPRPGDVDAVQATGLNQWFERQLNPGTIDDRALDERLSVYPAMGMPVESLRQRYPGPGVIRAMVAGKLPMPSDPTERVLVADQIEFYKAGKAKREAAAAAGQATGGMVGQGTGDMGGQATGTSMPAGDAAVLERDRTREQAIKRSVLALPPDRRMQSMLAMKPIDLVAFRQSLNPGEVAELMKSLRPEERETFSAMQGSLRMVTMEETDTRVLRDIYSERQLEAVMTDFWLNHFNVFVHKNESEPYLIPAYERETIRPRALGSFEDLLVATAKSPAMLEYLDNFRSIGPDSPAANRRKKVGALQPNGMAQASAGLNENYGRELMELHTLGVNGGYTQRDVTEVAKVFTGWTIQRRGQVDPSDDGSFVFDERRHEPGVKTVLGKKIRDGGESEGLEVLHLLATSPATAHFISQKLAIRFVSDAPPSDLVDRMAKTFLASGGDIKAVLRTMWRSPEFWSTEVYRAKVKTPLEFVVSAARASDLKVDDARALVQSLERLGMPLYGMQTPNGYSWMGAEWVSTGALVSRMNFALVLSGGKLPGTREDWAGLLGASAGTVAAATSRGVASEDAGAVNERRLELMLLGEPVSDRTRATVLGQANVESVTAQAETQFGLRGQGQAGREKGADQGSGTRVVMASHPVERDDTQKDAGGKQLAAMAGLLLGSPEFQRR